MSGSVKDDFMAAQRSTKPLTSLLLTLAVILAGVVVASSDNLSVVRGVAMVVIIFFAIGGAITFLRDVQRDEQRVEKEWDEIQALASRPLPPSPTRRH